ncbi:MAG: TatD family hydrolase [Candidatus Heimdallarchaeota archaeon]
MLNTPTFVDVHCHISLYENPRIIVQSANKYSVSQIISVSNDLTTSIITEKLAKSFAEIIPAFGIHPDYSSSWKTEIGDISSLVKKRGFIGEIGLDHSLPHNKESLKSQLDAFEAQLRIAEVSHCTINVHSRRAEKTVLEAISSHKIRNVIMHWYTGPLNLLSKFVDINCFFSWGPQAIRSKHVQQLIRRAGEDVLLTESDGPFSYKGILGDPTQIPNLVHDFALLLHKSEEYIKEAIWKNFQSLFQSNRSKKQQKKLTDFF